MNRGHRNAHLVHARAIGRVEVLDPPPTITTLDDAVLAGDRGIRNHKIIGTIAADTDLIRRPTIALTNLVTIQNRNVWHRKLLRLHCLGV